MLWNKYDGVILDLDGVIYIGDYAVAHAIDSVNALSVPVTAATNNASRPVSVVGNHLRSLGLTISDENIVTSAQAGAAAMAEAVGVGERVLVVGGVGVEDCLREVGIHPIRAMRDHKANAVVAGEVAGVLQGHGADTSWWDLTTAVWAIERGATWIVTNTDLSVPTPHGLWPGNGVFVAAVQSLSESHPLIVGKPQPTLFRQCMAVASMKNPLVIGDRLDTDIDGALAAGLDSLLVLTGVSTVAEINDRELRRRPTYIAADLTCLLEDGPPAKSSILQ